MRTRPRGLRGSPARTAAGIIALCGANAVLLRILEQCRVDQALDLRMARQPLGDARRVLALAIHAQRNHRQAPIEHRAFVGLKIVTKQAAPAADPTLERSCTMPGVPQRPDPARSCDWPASGGDIATQATRALDNVKVLLKACGPGLNQIVVIVG